MIVALETPTWAGTSAIGASHYYGRLKWNDQTECTDGSNYHCVELEKVLTAAEARRLTKQDHRPGDHNFVWKAGMKTERFFNKEEVIALALATYKTHCPAATCLQLGGSGIYEPYPILDGPKEFMDAVNVLAAEKEACGDWDTNPEAMQRITEAWEALVAKWIK